MSTKMLKTCRGFK